MKIYHPATAAEALSLRIAEENSAYLAGGTDDLRLGSPNEGKDLIDLNGILDAGILQKEGRIVIGALCTLQALKEAPEVPEFIRQTACFCASMVKRNSATVGGNLGARRQDSYLAAALAAADADLTVLTPKGIQTKKVADYMNCACKCLILSIEFDAEITGTVTRFGNTVSSHAAVIAAQARGIYALSVSGSAFAVGSSPALASTMTFTDDLTGSASYKKYLAEIVFGQEG